MNPMRWQLSSGRVVKTCYALALVSAAFPAYYQTSDVLLAAETASRGRNFEAVFRAVSGDAAMDRQAASAAKDSLSDNALDSQSLMNIVFATGFHNRDTRPLELLAMTGQVSRRSYSYLTADLLVSAEGQDMQRLMVAFDRMASLVPGFREKLFSIGAPILDRPDGARLLAQRQSRPWFSEFLAHIARQPDRLDKVAAFLISAKITDAEAQKRLLWVILNKYVEYNQIAKAQFFASHFGNFKNIEWNSLDFRNSNQEPSINLFAWRFPNDDAQVVIEANGNVKFVISDDISAKPLAEKILIFKPGKHRIRTGLKLNDASDDVFLAWEVRCVAFPIRQESRVTVNNSNNQKSIDLVFEATEQCTGYRLSLFLTAPSRRFEDLEITLSAPSHWQAQ